MPAHPHIIKRHLVDLQIDSRLDGSQIQERVSQTLKNDLLPVIDRYLSTIDSGEETYRINYLEVDLGIIRVNGMEEQLKERLELQLGSKQLKSIPFTTEAVTSGKEITSRNRTNFDLIAHFLTTGTLPWWVNDSSPLVLKTAIAHLLDVADGNISNLFHTAVSNSALLKRLIHFCDDTLLFKLIAKTAPDFKVTYDSQRQLSAAFSGIVSPNRFRQFWWTTVLQKSISYSVPPNSPQPLLQLFFEAMAQEEGRYLNPVAGKVTVVSLTEFYNKQVGTLNVILSVVMGVSIENSNSLSDNLEVLIRLMENHRSFSSIHHVISGFTVTGTDKPGLTKKGYDRNPSEITRVQLLLNAIRKFFRIQPVLYPAIEIAGKMARIVPNKATSESEEPSPEGADQVEKPTLREEARNPGNLLPNKAGNRDQPITSSNVEGENGISLFAPKNESLIGGQRPVRYNEKEVIPPSEYHSDGAPEPMAKVSLPDPFSETDKLYIADAGLILLAPFLARFFKNIEFVDGNAFNDQEASEKACLLLQYLAQGAKWEPFEPHLVLNKLLCGIELHYPVDVQLGITQDELDAAEQLLEAVIANAPLWKTLSVEGLRNAYLQREGILSSRDGNWLLQVKREAYDILVDRLPWSTRVVKLPWMKNLIFVEWQLD